MVHVMERLEFRIALNGNCIEAISLADIGESRLERGQGLHGGIGPHMLVAIEKYQTVNILHRNNRSGKSAFSPALGGALLALNGVGIHVIARKAVFGGDEIGGDALWQ